MPGRTPQFYVPSYAFPTADTFDPADYSTLAKLVKGVAPDWSMERHRDTMGAVSVIIIPPSVDDTVGPTLIIRKAASVFHLDQFRWDEYDSLGDYLDLNNLSGAVRDMLMCQPTMAGISTTLH